MKMDAFKLVKRDGAQLALLTGKEPDLREIIELLYREGVEHHVWFGLATMPDEEYAAIVARSPQEQQRENDQALASALEYHQRGLLFGWRVMSGSEHAGWMLLVLFVGAPYLHFVPKPAHASPEARAAMVDGALTTAVELIGAFFDQAPREHWLWLFPFLDQVDDLDPVLVRHGFDQWEEASFINRQRQTAYALSRDTYAVYHRGH